MGLDIVMICEESGTISRYERANGEQCHGVGSLVYCLLNVIRRKLDGVSASLRLMMLGEKSEWFRSVSDNVYGKTDFCDDFFRIMNREHLGNDPARLSYVPKEYATAEAFKTVLDTFSGSEEGRVLVFVSKSKDIISKSEPLSGTDTGAEFSFDSIVTQDNQPHLSLFFVRNTMPMADMLKLSSFNTTYDNCHIYDIGSLPSDLEAFRSRAGKEAALTEDSIEQSIKEKRGLAYEIYGRIKEIAKIEKSYDASAG